LLVHSLADLKIADDGHGNAVIAYQTTYTAAGFPAPDQASRADGMIVLDHVAASTVSAHPEWFNWAA
jgi:hypothetical protein